MRIFVFFKVAFLLRPGWSQERLNLENPGVCCLTKFSFKKWLLSLFPLCSSSAKHWTGLPFAICHLPAVLTCRCCFPALRETKLLGFCGARHGRLCNFYFYFLAWSALGAFSRWLGLRNLFAGTSVLLPSHPTTQQFIHMHVWTDTGKQRDVS